MEIKEIFETLSTSFSNGRTLPYSYRIQQLKQLLKLYEENIPLILESLKEDLRKSELEGYLYEVDLMLNDCRNAIRNLKDWMKDVHLKTNILMPQDTAYVQRIPKGVVLIIAPYNYPWQLSLVPLCGALAGGNCVILKPSESAPASSKLMATLIHKYLDPNCYRVVVGDVAVAQALLKEPFAHIFYTGCLDIAKEIAAVASKNVIPCTFELGGKSPVYIDDTVHYERTIQRVLWGKCMNMGQTCVAPDYILCNKKVEKELLKHAKNVMISWYGHDWQKAKDLARIVNKKHFLRLKRLLQSGGEIAMGGQMCEDDLWIDPSIIVDVQETDAIMQEEIFGPLLPIFTVENEDEAIAFLKKRPTPLCLYVFSSMKATQSRFKSSIQSGTLVFNDTIVHFAIDELPFGGLGPSGYGSYHGKFTFDEFTHKRSIARRNFSWYGDQVGIFRYPPYTPIKINFLSFLLNHWKRFQISFRFGFWEGVWFLAGILITYLYFHSQSSS